MPAHQLPADFFQRLATPALAQDPYAQLERLRVDPAPRLRSGEVVLGHHADVERVLRSPVFLKPRLPPVPLRSVRTMLRMFLLLNAPDHPRLRRAVAPLFTPAAVAARRDLIECEVERLLHGRTDLDVVRDLAYPLPLHLVCTWLGVRRGDEPRIEEWAKVLLANLDGPVPLGPRDAVRYAAAVARRRSRPVATVLAIRAIGAYARDLLRGDGDAEFLVVLRAAVADGTMSEDEAVATWALLVIAGHETTANLIGNTVHLLMAHPQQLADLQDDGSLVGAAIEESLRVESPVPMGVRVPSEPVSLAGHDLDAGAPVFVVIASANRDPEVFTDPDRFDLRRDAVANIAFGHGAHVCIGAQLARTEASAAVAAVVARRPVGIGGRPRWRPTFATRSLEALPVRLGSSA
ncbi:MAG: cytochrome P450 [Acidimicrobiales bacterium]